MQNETQVERSGKVGVREALLACDPYLPSKESDDLGDAANAVAELIAAAEFFATDDRQHAWHPSYRPQMDRLRAALSAIRGEGK